MRQGHQNRRGRGRNNNQNQHRRNQNPLSRSFESTGPDIKIRGTPSHIAEKYMALARDAASSGDPVLAENYLQHAEHYNRIILAVREQQMGQGGDQNLQQLLRPNQGLLGDRFGEPEDLGDEEGGDDSQQPEAAAPGMEGQPQPATSQQFQPNSNYQPREHRGDRDRGDGGQRFDNRRDREGGFRNGGQRHERHDRGDRGYDRNFDRNSGERQFRDRDDRPPRDDRGGDREPREGGFNQRRRENFRPDTPPPGPGPSQAGGSAGHEQPEFLRRPVRRPRSEDAPAPVDESQD